MLGMTSGARTWVLPDEPAPVRVMNTIWAGPDGINDDWGSPAALHEWLAAVTDYEPAAFAVPSAAELAQARALRDAMRRLAAFCIDDRRPHAQSPVETVDDAVAAVNAAVAQRAQAQLAIRDGRLQREQVQVGTAFCAALGDLAHDGVDLLTGPDAVKLRACHAPGCVLYFMRSHPRREWCSDSCGNRARAARHYERVRARKESRP
jgi:predicted RNA-binding Zn ribbon-like protein